MSEAPVGTVPGEDLLPRAADWALAAFENAPIGMVVTSLGGGILRYNRAFAALLGYTPEELGTETWASVTHPDDVEASRALVARLVAGEASSGRIEKRYVGRGGASCTPTSRRTSFATRRAAPSTSSRTPST